MKTMLAAYLPGNSTVDLREVAVPTPGINQVLIKMKSSGICGSDVHYIYHQHLSLIHILVGDPLEFGKKLGNAAADYFIANKIDQPKIAVINCEAFEVCVQRRKGF